MLFGSKIVVILGEISETGSMKRINQTIKLVVQEEISLIAISISQIHIPGNAGERKVKKLREGLKEMALLGLEEDQEKLGPAVLKTIILMNLRILKIESKRFLKRKKKNKLRHHPKRKKFTNKLLFRFRNYYLA